jgi:hypothetical protein
MTRGLRLAVIGSLLALLCSLVPLTAGADQSSSPAVGPIPAGYFGLPSNIELAGSQASTYITIPPVIGIEPTELTLAVQWPANISAGTLEAINTQSNIRVASIAAPGPATNSTWVIPISSSVGHPETLELTSTLLFAGTGETCGPIVSSAMVRLFPLAVGYTTVSNTFSVGTYLVGPIATVNMVLPAAPSSTLLQAAINLDVAIVANAVDKDVAVNLLPPGSTLPPPSATVRNVVFTGTGVPSIVVSPQQMTIAGASPLAQVRLLATNPQLLAEGNSRAVTVPGATVARASTLTLAQLGVAQASAGGIGQFSVPVGFDQAMTGGQVSSATFSLAGTAAAQATGTSATVTAMLGSTPLTTTRIPADGHWTLTGSIPAELMSRTIGLSVQVGYFGGQGRCSGLLPLQVAVDTTSSSFTFSPGIPAAPISFLNVPQLLLPSASVVLGDRSFGTTEELIDLVAGVQRMSPLPLSLTLIDGTTVPTTPSLVVAGSPSPLAHRLIPASLVDNTAQFTTPAGVERVVLGPSEAILTVSSTTPTVALLDGSSDSSSGRRLLDAIGTLQSSWLNLRGDVVATTPDGQVAQAQVAVATTATTIEAVVAWYDIGWVRVVLGILLLLLGLAVGLAIGRRRRSSSAPQG